MAACSGCLARNCEYLCFYRSCCSRFSWNPGLRSFPHEVLNLVAFVGCRKADHIAYQTFVVVAYSADIPDNILDLVFCLSYRSNRRCGLVPNAFRRHAAEK